MSEDLARSAQVPRYPWTMLSVFGAFLVAFGVFGPDRVVTYTTIFLEIVFIIFFARHMAFAIAALNSADIDLNLPSLDIGYRPTISVIVACKNEGSVVDILVHRLLALDYPRDKVTFYVIDDGSDDSTGELLDAWAESEHNLKIVHRPPGKGGGKSGALNEALQTIDSEVVVVFDADHEPRTDVLWRLARHFQDPTVCAVQGRCVISNPGDSPLAQLVAIDYLAGYLVNEYGRQAIFRLPAYGGANCAVRTSALRDLGGWNPQTVTEDTDLTMQLLLCGKRVRYDVTAIDEEEGVVTLRHYWRQRYRWARGHQQVWRDYRGAVWRSERLGFLDKLETTMFLLVFHIPVMSFVGLVLLVLWLLGITHPGDSIHAYLLWTLLFLGPLLELGGGILIGRPKRSWIWSLVLFLPLFFVSIALCTKAWFDGVLGRRYSWVKTARAQDTPGVTSA